MEGKYYVYEISKQDGEVVYVGKGTKDRAYYHLKYKTNEHLWNIIQQEKSVGRDMKVDIIYRTDDEQEAYAKEIEVISKYGIRREGGQLCNFTLGGEAGPDTGWQKKIWVCLKAQKLLGKVPDKDIAEQFYYPIDSIQKARLRLGIPSYKASTYGLSVDDDGRLRDKRTHVVFNKMTEEIFIGRRQSFVKLHSMSTGVAHRFFGGSNKKSFGHWLYCGTVDNIIREPYVDRSELDCLVLEHKDGTIFKGTREKFKQQYPSASKNMTNMLCGRQQTHKGWSIKGVLKCIDEYGNLASELTQYEPKQEYNSCKKNK